MLKRVPVDMIRGKKQREEDHEEYRRTASRELREEIETVWEQAYNRKQRKEIVLETKSLNGL